MYTDEHGCLTGGKREAQRRSDLPATPQGFHISAQWLRRSAVLRRYPGSTVQQNSATLKAVASSRFTHHATPKGSYLAFVREPTTSFSASRHARKMRQRTCEVIPVFQDIEFNRHLQAVLHELDVALQRRYAHFERTRHLCAIRILPILDHPMNPHHPLQRRPAIPMRPQISARVRYQRQGQMLPASDCH